MNQKTNSLIKSILSIFAISIITACSNDDAYKNPCENSTLTVTAAVEEYNIIANVTGGIEPYEYSIDGSTFQTSNIFNGVESRDYTLTVIDASNCIATTSVSEAHINSLLDERDGQRYKIVKIGNQTWLAENFNYNNSTATETTSWCYDDVTTNCDTYGRLYTWEAASQVAPEGWRLPTQGDWQNLINEVGGNNMAHIELAQGDFKLLSAGRIVEGQFSYKDEYAFCWSSSPAQNNDYVFFLTSDTDIAAYQSPQNYGYSVRLIKIQNN